MNVYHFKSKSFTLPKKITYNNQNIFFLPRYQKVKNWLKRVKGIQDTIYSDQEHYSKTIYDTLLMNNTFKDKLKDYLGDAHISMAWAKLIEMLIEFPLIDKQKPKLRTFDLCSAPGMWTKATVYYVKNLTKIKDFVWYATTLKPEHSKHAFGNNYHIIEKNPNRFVFGESGTGDITDSNNVKEFWNLGPFDFASSDCGVYKDSKNPEDFLEEEARNSNVFFGALLTILGSLKKGGNMVMKTFTILDSAQISLVYLICASFKKVYFAKPMTSKPANSEIYIVAEGYQKNISATMMEFLLDILDNYDPYKSIFTLKDIPKKFLDELLDIQMNSIEKTIKNLERIDYYYRHPEQKEKIQKEREDFLNTFYNKYGKFLKSTG